MSSKYLGKILEVDSALLESLDKKMASATGRERILDTIAEENQGLIKKALEVLNSGIVHSADEIAQLLQNAIVVHEKQLLSFLESVEGGNEFEKAANLARKMARVGNGFFLKREFARKIFLQCRPENLLKHLGYATVEHMLAREDVIEAFSALRFMESQEWMHKTFEAAYSIFTPDDFEERPIEIKVLGPQWREVAERFVAKKHHNVSHLKEFGVIFLNPIKEDLEGKFLRDFALLLHYFHEVEFYAKLFKKHSAAPDFSTHLKALLRGDVKEAQKTEAGEWFIVQRYLWKENSSDTRLFLPRINPESMHWARGERDLTTFGAREDRLEVEFWNNSDWVADYFDHQNELVSFDLEDNAMSLVSTKEGKNERFTYHQREALWTKIFQEYAGGEVEMERLLIENFDKGM